MCDIRGICEVKTLGAFVVGHELRESRVDGRRALGSGRRGLLDWVELVVRPEREVAVAHVRDVAGASILEEHWELRCTVGVGVGLILEGGWSLGRHRQARWRLDSPSRRSLAEGRPPSWGNTATVGAVPLLAIAALSVTIPDLVIAATVVAALCSSPALDSVLGGVLLLWSEGLEGVLGELLFPGLARGRRGRSWLLRGGLLVLRRLRRLLVRRRFACAAKGLLRLVEAAVGELGSLVVQLLNDLDGEVVLGERAERVVEELVILDGVDSASFHQHEVDE